MLRTREDVLAKIRRIPQDHDLDPSRWADIEEIEEIEKSYWDDFKAYTQSEIQRNHRAAEETTTKNDRTEKAPPPPSPGRGTAATSSKRRPHVRASCQRHEKNNNHGRRRRSRFSQKRSGSEPASPSFNNNRTDSSARLNCHSRAPNGGAQKTPSKSKSDSTMWRTGQPLKK